MRICFGFDFTRAEAFIGHKLCYLMHMAKILSVWVSSSFFKMYHDSPPAPSHPLLASVLSSCCNKFPDATTDVVMANNTDNSEVPKVDPKI